MSSLNFNGLFLSTSAQHEKLSSAFSYLKCHATFRCFSNDFLVWSLPRAQKVRPEKGLETDQPETSLTGSRLNADVSGLLH